MARHNRSPLGAARIGTSSWLTVVGVAGRPSWVAWASGANPGLFGAHLRADPLGLFIRTDESAKEDSSVARPGPGRRRGINAHEARPALVPSVTADRGAA
jgi:hypothetical protein